MFLIALRVLIQSSCCNLTRPNTYLSYNATGHGDQSFVSYYGKPTIVGQPLLGCHGIAPMFDSHKENFGPQCLTTLLHPRDVYIVVDVPDRQPAAAR